MAKASETDVEPQRSGFWQWGNSVLLFLPSALKCFPNLFLHDPNSFHRVVRFFP